MTEPTQTPAERIDAIRREWGTRLLILGHLYQRPTVLAHADATGDSLELARRAATARDAQRIVFCGVRFMAESADILTSPAQTVYMPETNAGCPMADMTTAEALEQALRELRADGGDWLPIAYVNSSAAVKACCGRWGGSTCTSSNAARVFRWALDQGRRILFVPDEHLGANTAHDLGLPDASVRRYDPQLARGGLSAADVHAARVIVWKGFCIVHIAFTVDQVRQIRAQLPGARIIVHPETPGEVVRLCDAHGSTAQIIRYVEAAPAGSTIVIGTELNLVQRLAEEHRGRLTIKALRPSVCANMAKTNPLNLLDVLERWPADREVHVAADVAAEARKALEQMLAL